MPSYGKPLSWLQEDGKDSAEGACTLELPDWQPGPLCSRERSCWHPWSPGEGAAAPGPLPAAWNVRASVFLGRQGFPAEFEEQKGQPWGCQLREGFSHSMVWQWNGEDPLET